MTDDPILTPPRVLALRGVDPATVHFDLAVFCFRGRQASRLMIEATAACQVPEPLLYGTRSYKATIDGLSIAVLPGVVWGGPVTAILLEELHCLGVKTAIGFGAAGSLITEAHIGRMFVAERAAASDGTSREYSDDPWLTPDLELLALARKLSAVEAVSPLEGRVWTTDALYLERPSALRRWRAAGATLVNLEASPFYAAATALGIHAVYLGLVTDYVSEDRGWHDGDWGRTNLTDPIIVRTVRRLVETLAVGSEP